MNIIHRYNSDDKRQNDALMLQSKHKGLS